MLLYQYVSLISWFIYCFTSFVLGSIHNFKNKNPYGRCLVFAPTGSFVWADAIVFGSFWSILSLLFIFSQSWIFFLITLSLFWLVRSLGETIYWFNQQFTDRELDPRSSFVLSKYFPGTSVWFVHQILYQCVTVLSGLALIYLLKLYFLH